MIQPNGASAPVGRFGAWIGSDILASDIGATCELAAQIEEMGFSTLWTGNADGGLALPDKILRSTRRLCVATGIVNIWRFTAAEVAANHHRVIQAHPRRFILGIGVGHAPHTPNYERPLAKLESYLDELDAAEQPVPRRERVIAALGPRALRLAAARTRGTCPFLVPPEHTADVRTQVGDEPLLAPEQKVVLEADPAAARRIAREALAIYLTLPNYVNNLRRYGLGDDDFANGGSDRFVDTLVAWGDDETIRTRLQAHLDAGADHVAVHVLGPVPAVEAVEQRRHHLATRWKQVSELLPER